jgi:hypothetical protein
MLCTTFSAAPTPVIAPEHAEDGSRRDLFGAFGLADAVFPGARRGLEEHDEWFTVYVEAVMSSMLPSCWSGPPGGRLVS